MPTESKTTICSHTIIWWYSGWNPVALPESEEEHIKEGICKGFVAGELCYLHNTKERRGWWRIARQVEL